MVEDDVVEEDVVDEVVVEVLDAASGGPAESSLQPNSSRVAIATTASEGPEGGVGREARMAGG